jgi:hypothetical protein
MTVAILVGQGGNFPDHSRFEPLNHSAHSSVETMQIPVLLLNRRKPQVAVGCLHGADSHSRGRLFAVA